MTRRLAALAASLFLINLNVIVVDRACGSRHETTPASREHTGHEHHAPARAPAEQHEAPTKCCDAISTCGVTLSLGGDVAMTPATPDAVSVERMALRSPSSVPRAPEPPPPRA